MINRTKGGYLVNNHIYRSYNSSTCHRITVMIDMCIALTNFNHHWRIGPHTGTHSQTPTFLQDIEPPLSKIDRQDSDWSITSNHGYLSLFSNNSWPPDSFQAFNELEWLALSPHRSLILSQLYLHLVIKSCRVVPVLKPSAGLRPDVPPYVPPGALKLGVHEWAPPFVPTCRF